MKIWTTLKRSGSALAMVAIAGSTASAQYSPFGPMNTGAAAPQQYGAPQQYQQPQYYQGQPQYQPQQPQYAAPPGGQNVPYMASRANGYPATGAPMGPRFAMDPAAAAASAAAQVLPTPANPQAEAVTPPAGAAMTPAPVNMPSSAPMGNSYPAPNYPSSSITPTPAPMNYSEGYGAPATNYSAPAAGCDGDGAPCNDYPMTTDCAPTCDVGYTLPKRQWFAGMYGLFMQRSNPGRFDLGVQVTGTPTYPYYPVPTDTVLHSSPDSNFAGGAEVRFGSTFGKAGCGCNCYQPYAWEVGYWGLANDTNQEVLTANPFTGNTRMYGMINYAGLQQDRTSTGNNYRPVNEYTDYQNPINPPATPNDIRVLGIRVRESFSAQNLELNFWRFGNPGGLSSCSPSNSGGCNSCSPCGGYSTCDPCVKPQRLFVNGLAGLRYFRVDNDLSIAYDDTPSSTPAVYSSNSFDLYHDVNVDNKLVGFQIGGSANYAVTCKFSAFLDTNFGIYGNDMTVHQRVYGTGVVRDTDTFGVANYSSSKSDVAFLSEARLGVGYQFLPCWRATVAWRVLALSGVAIAGEQVPANGFSNHAQINYIDSNDSIILHGLQAGVECKF